MNTRSLYKKRNITKKSYKYFKNNLHKYLSIKEQSQIKGTNDLLKYKKYPKKVKIITTLTLQKSNTAYYEKKIRQQLLSTDLYVTEDYPQIKLKYSKGNYKKYYIKKLCGSYDILNIDKLAIPFTYFSITPFLLNPSKTHLLFGVDFIGNRCYHLFIKSLYSNEIKEIPIPKHTVLDTSRLSNTESTVSDTFTWLSDDSIAFIGLNRYYNQQTA